VASTLVSKLPPCPILFDFNSDIFKQFYKSVLVNNLHQDSSPVTEDFIFSELEKLNPNKSTGSLKMEHVYFKNQLPI
jgi:hypothetical protein